MAVRVPPLAQLNRPEQAVLAIVIAVIGLVLRAVATGGDRR